MKVGIFKEVKRKIKWLEREGKEKKENQLFIFFKR